MKRKTARSTELIEVGMKFAGHQWRAVLASQGSNLFDKGIQMKTALAILGLMFAVFLVGLFGLALMVAVKLNFLS